MDLEFTFAYTYRNVALGASMLTPTNGNYVAAGWNLQPSWSDYQFHYVTQDGTPNGVPYFRSFPFEALFWDPDVRDANVNTA